MITDANIKAYQEYSSMPNYVRNSKNELYENGWVILTGRSIVSPHPHRKYTLNEFISECGRNEKLKNRFLRIEERELKINDILK